MNNDKGDHRAVRIYRHRMIERAWLEVFPQLTLDDIATHHVQHPNCIPPKDCIDEMEVQAIL